MDGWIIIVGFCDRYQKRTTFPTFLAYAHIATWLCMTTRGHARPTGNGGSAVRCDYWFATSTLRPRIVRAENWRTFTPPPRRSVSRFPFSLLALSCPGSMRRTQQRGDPPAHSWSDSECGGSKNANACRHLSLRYPDPPNASGCLAYCSVAAASP